MTRMSYLFASILACLLMIGALSISGSDVVLAQKQDTPGKSTFVGGVFICDCTTTSRECYCRTN